MGRFLIRITVATSILWAAGIGFAQQVRERPRGQLATKRSSYYPAIPEREISTVKGGLKRMLAKEDFDWEKDVDEHEDIALKYFMRVSLMNRLRETLEYYERRLSDDDRNLLDLLNKELDAAATKPDMQTTNAADGTERSIDAARSRLAALGASLQGHLEPTPINDATLTKDDRAQFHHLLKRFTRISTPREDAAIQEIRNSGEQLFFLFSGPVVWKEALAALESAGAYEHIANGLVDRRSDMRKAAARALTKADEASTAVVSYLISAIRQEGNQSSDIESLEEPHTHLRTLIGLLAKFTSLSFNVRDYADTREIERVLQMAGTWLSEHMAKPESDPIPATEPNEADLQIDEDSNSVPEAPTASTTIPVELEGEIVFQDPLDGSYVTILADDGVLRKLAPDGSVMWTADVQEYTASLPYPLNRNGGEAK